MSAPELAARLPEIETVRRWSQSLAMLDAILGPEWHDRLFSFDAHWAPGEQLASMRTGSGDAYGIVFSSAGAYLWGFDHESPMSPYAQDPQAPWPGLVDTVPDELRAQVSEPAFTFEGIPQLTVCLWRLVGDSAWSHGAIAFPPGDDPDGADSLFEELDGEPATYRDLAAWYWERELDVDAIGRVYRHEPLTEELVRVLAPEMSLGDVETDGREIGYRFAGSSA